MAINIGVIMAERHSVPFIKAEVADKGSLSIKSSATAIFQ